LLCNAQDLHSPSFFLTLSEGFFSIKGLAVIMVHLGIFLVTLTLASSGGAAPVVHRQSCVSGLYIIAARGSNEDPGEGKVGQVSELIKNAVPGSTSVAVDYPAAIIDDDSFYPLSVSEGIDDTIEKITSYVDTCGSSSRIVLLGYSQGGNVMTDTLSGGGLKPDPLPETYRTNSERQNLPWLTDLRS
jgi:acetylxylan esterase